MWLSITLLRPADQYPKGRSNRLLRPPIAYTHSVVHRLTAFSSPLERIPISQECLYLHDLYRKIYKLVTGCTRCAFLATILCFLSHLPFALMHVFREPCVTDHLDD